jgi:glycosyltransferase involved in cell wall biosynthesis
LLEVGEVSIFALEKHQDGREFGDVAYAYDLALVERLTHAQSNPGIVHGETGMLVPCDDAEALASAMHTLMVDPEKRARMSRRARTRAVEVFSLEASARPFLDWYDRALADPIAS